MSDAKSSLFCLSDILIGKVGLRSLQAEIADLRPILEGLVEVSRDSGLYLEYLRERIAPKSHK